MNKSIIEKVAVSEEEADANLDEDKETDNLVAEEPPLYHQGEIDRLTLELLMNKTHYQKYMSTTNPEKFAKQESFLSDLKKYRQRILNLTHELLDRPNTQISVQINSVFEAYMKAMIDHIKQKEMEADVRFESNADPFEDTMFGTVDEPTVEQPSTTTQSFWGKERVVKRDHDRNVFSNYFTKTKR